jgi:molybdate transport system substrate-binding protein
VTHIPVRALGPRVIGTLSAVTLVAVTLVACGSPEDAAAPLDAGGRPEIVVFAAASLTDVLEELGAEFAAAGGARVVLNVAGSQTLATQILEGAPADLFVSADTVQMERVAAAGRLADEPVTVATNVLAVAVEAANPHAVTGLADLSRPDLVVVLPAEEVPAGRYAAEVLARAGVAVRPASLERSVRAALAKVAQGEADAAIVYASDVVASRRSGAAVEGVAIPAEQNVVTTSTMALVMGGASPDAARAFATFLRSERGREVLVAHGFGAP